MTTLPLHLRDGHLFLETAGALWLFDTGAPTSFGSSSALTLAGEQFRLGSSYLGLTPATLSRFVAVEYAGLLGADILGRFDFFLDAPNGTVTISTNELEHSGVTVTLDEFMGIPIVSARIRGIDYRMFLDTGAQISYFQHDSLASFPAAGRVADFYPGVGQFQTETRNVDITLGGVEFTLRCGALPGLLGATLMMAETEGIISNQVFSNRSVGYFPRRRSLIL
ncbi:hypothetical protein IMZ48_48235 [Candidatus Bathyarchaeota archaeon]|nr:hypothetical protein [Candidatus Bathyarchaeota archaeon]